MPLGKPTLVPVAALLALFGTSDTLASAAAFLALASALAFAAASLALALASLVVDKVLGPAWVPTMWAWPGGRSVTPP